MLVSRATPSHLTPVLVMLVLNVTQESCGRRELGRTEHGSLYVGGNELRPPYRFVIEDSVLMVNGVQIEPYLYPRSAPPPPKLSPSELLRAGQQHQLIITNGDWASAQRRNGVPDDSILTSLVQRYLASDLVEGARVGSQEVLVRWKGLRGEEHIPLPPAHIPPQPSRREQRETRFTTDARQILATLDRDGVVYLGKDYWIITVVGPESSRAWVARLRREGKASSGVFTELQRDILHPDPIDRRKLAK